MKKNLVDLLEKIFPAIIQSCNPSTRNAYEIDLQQFKDWLHKTNSVRIDPNKSYTILLNEYLDWLQQSSGSQDKPAISTLHRKWSVIKRCFRLLFQSGEISRDDTGQIKLPKLPQGISRPLNTDEMTRLLLATVPDSRDHTMISILFYTGIRANELLNLTVSSIESGFLYILEGKGNKSRSIPIPPQLAMVLARYIEQIPQSDPGTKLFNISYQRLYQLIKIYGRRAGIDPENIHPHTFRHTYGNQINLATGNIKAIQELLGHKSIATTENYLKRLPQHVLVNTVSQAFPGGDPIETK